jgi:hypothetical protein
MRFQLQRARRRKTLDLQCPKNATSSQYEKKLNTMMSSAHQVFQIPVTWSLRGI